MDRPRLLRKKKAIKRARARTAKPRVEEENIPVAAPEPEPTNDEPGALFKVTSTGGFDVWCDGARWHGRQLIFMSTYGHQTAVRSYWSGIVGKKHSSIQIGDQYLSIGDTYYNTLKSLLAHQYLHLVVIHPSATSAVSAFGSSFYLVGDNPRERYWSRFSRMCQVPMRQEWREDIWTLGLEKKLIEPLAGFGVDAYYVDTGASWVAVIQEAVKSRRLR